MSSISLKIDNEGKSKILKSFEKTLEDLDKDVELILKWVKTQPHLPEIPSANMIGFFLLSNKFSIEVTKQKLDMYYTVKSMFPDIFNKINPKLQRMKNGLQTQYILPLPKLIDGIYRATLFKVTPHSKNFDGNTQIASLINTFEIRLQEDVMVSDIAIFDFEHLSIEHVIKTTPMHVKTATFILEKVFSNRVKEVHIFNHPPIFDKLLALAKMFIKPKLHNRLHLHDSLNSLCKFVPLEVLPKDYGGKEKSIKDLDEMWKRKLSEYADRFDKLDTLRVNEHLRPMPMKDNGKYGIQGTFRKLNVD